MKQKMKNILIKSAVVLFTIILTWSCQHDLEDNFAESALSEATFFKTESDFKLFANNFYGSLPAHGTWSRDDMSDITTSVNGNSVSRGQHVAGFTSGTWDGSYALIRSTSTLIDRYNTADEAIQPEILKYTGEARFFRAMAYFNLLKTFGGVPLIDDVLDVENEALYGPRNTRDEIVNFIIADLKDAVNQLSTQSALPGGDNGRITSGAANAFLSRVALFEGTWQKNHGGNNANTLLQEAITASNAVISDSSYELFDRRDVLGDDNYKYLFTLDKKQSNPANLTKSSNKEFILTAIRDLDEKGHNSRPDPVNGLNPTKVLADMYLCTDGLPVEKSPLYQGKSLITSEYENRDPRMLMSRPLDTYFNSQQSAWTRNWADLNDPTRGTLNLMEIPGRTATGYITVKFLLENETPNGTDYPVIRLAEVMLNFAEATFELNGSISDSDLNKSINMLRNRVGVAPLTAALVGANGLDILTEIRRERTTELFAEGFRYDDIRRWKIAETVLPQAQLGIKYGGTEFETHPTFGAYVVTVNGDGYIIADPTTNRSFDANKHYLFPLPLRQLQLNENLMQNPGW